MTTAVPDPSFRDQAAELLFPFGVPHRLGYEDRERWDRVAKALAEVEARVQAAANQRDTELRRAWNQGYSARREGQQQSSNPYSAAALASPAPAGQHTTDEKPCGCLAGYDCADSPTR